MVQRVWCVWVVLSLHQRSWKSLLCVGTSSALFRNKLHDYKFCHFNDSIWFCYDAHRCVSNKPCQLCKLIVRNFEIHIKFSELSSCVDESQPIESLKYSATTTTTSRSDQIKLIYNVNTVMMMMMTPKNRTKWPPPNVCNKSTPSKWSKWYVIRFNQCICHWTPRVLICWSFYGAPQEPKSGKYNNDIIIMVRCWLTQRDIGVSLYVDGL